MRSHRLPRRAFLSLGLGLGTGLRVAAPLLAAGCAWRDPLLFWPPSPVPLDDPSLVDIRTKDGRIYGLHRRAEAGLPTLIWFHGNGGDVAGTASLLPHLGVPGAGVFLAEYPGYGALANERVSVPRVVERAHATVAYAREHLGCAPGTTVIGGYSLGAAIAAQVALAQPARGLVLCAPFSSFLRTARHHAGFLADLVVNEGLDTLRIAPRLALPTLLVHGAKDELVPPTMSAEIAAAAPHARRVVLRDSAHNDLFATSDGLAFALIRSFSLGGFEGVSSLGVPI